MNYEGLYEKLYEKLTVRKRGENLQVEQKVAFRVNLCKMARLTRNC